MRSGAAIEFAMDNEKPTQLQEEIEGFVAALARIFGSRGRSAEVAVLALGTPRCEVVGYDGWDGGTYSHRITIELSSTLYSQIADRTEAIEKSLHDGASQLLRRYTNTWLEGFVLLPEFAKDETWREKAKIWLEGKGVTNQGRVRSDNVAPYSHDGLLFRSRAEIKLYHALKSIGVSFAPLPVFLRGGETYRRIEPDFLIYHRGVLLVVEIDGQPFHQESPADAHSRLTLLQHEGARVERIHSTDCESGEKALATATKLVEIIERHAKQR